MKQSTENEYTQKSKSRILFPSGTITHLSVWRFNVRDVMEDWKANGLGRFFSFGWGSFRGLKMWNQFIIYTQEMRLLAIFHDSRPKISLFQPHGCRLLGRDHIHTILSQIIKHMLASLQLKNIVIQTFLDKYSKNATFSLQMFQSIWRIWFKR